ncbi:MAG: hypothetical protein IJT44_07525 [Clostridia bacterium]|nr:hypothetical protein [Clostridia bacterium]
MKKINHSFLIISIAAALVILGVAVTLGLRFGAIPGLLVGVISFTVLICCMLILNTRANKK